jgi:hypothetical protein
MLAGALSAACAEAVVGARRTIRQNEPNGEVPEQGNEDTEVAAEP